MNNKVLKTFLIFLAVFCLFMSVTVCAGTEYHQTTHNVVIKTDGGNTEYVMSEGTSQKQPESFYMPISFR